MTGAERNRRRALIVRRVAARKQSSAMREVWRDRRASSRTLDDEPTTEDDVDQAGSPDDGLNLDVLPDLVFE